MKIQNKKTEELYGITKEEWLFMKKRGTHRKYEVVDDRDITSQPESIEAIEIRPLDAVSEGVNDDKDERDVVMEMLDELGVKYHPNTGLEKLKQKLKEAENGE